MTGRHLQEKALCLASEEEVGDFQASNRWVSKWLKRRNVQQPSLLGVRASVSQEALDDCMQTHVNVADIELIYLNISWENPVKLKGDPM